MFPCLFQLPLTNCIPWLGAPPSVFRGDRCNLCSHPCISSLTLTLLLLKRILVITLGPLG